MGTTTKYDKLAFRKVEALLNDQVEFKKTVKSAQYDLPAFYAANIRSKDRPIFTQHGLQNFSSTKLGDRRIWYEQSFSQDVYNPEIKEGRKDYGLTREQIVANRRHDYDYALAKVSKQQLEQMSQIMKEKLHQRTRTGAFQLRRTFKYLDRDGSGDISFEETRYAFELMGFSFPETQILALFANYDHNYSGVITYKSFIERLMEQDFQEIKATWLLPKRKKKKRPQEGEKEAPSCLAEDPDASEYKESMEFEKDEIKKIFGFIDNQGRGFLDAYQLQALLLILGLPFKRDVLEHHVMAIDKSGQHMVDFPTFYEWWQQGGMAD